jgi:hypothetical protein
MHEVEFTEGAIEDLRCLRKHEQEYEDDRHRGGNAQFAGSA